MFEKQCFIKSVYDLKDIPDLRLPEIILCGRSNVGKSSFINSLFNRKELAKISSTPGKTRSINYYMIDDKFYVVDLPGYGYAKVSMEERKRWGKLVNEFINISGNIILACHIIDSRHKPTELDHQLNILLKHSEIPYLIILSKSDKLKQSELIPSKKLVMNTFNELTENEIIIYSAVKKTGRKEVLKKFSSIVN